ncbi:MAG: carboxymuconolactone decarboxylase family protein [Campylobacteraceae bacterium]|nr:carboxymuconolactone decarboxylase family protein [Campylobacteraceae bacterium]
MKNLIFAVVAAVALVGCAAVGPTAREGKVQNLLNEKEQSVAVIAAFTAKGDLEALRVALNEGLDAGLTVNEIKEVLIQMYAYTGFPRSLNGLNTFIEVVAAREQKGIKDVAGVEASAPPKDKLAEGTKIQTYLIGAPAKGAVYEFAPAIDRYLKEHLFGDIFTRGVLEYKDRELATIAALSALGVEAQLRGHLNVALNIKIGADELYELSSVISQKVGEKEGELIKQTLAKILREKK